MEQLNEEPLLIKNERIINEKEQKLKEMVEKDLYQNSNCCSKLFIGWIFPLLRLSNKRSLKINDLGNLDKVNESKTLLNSLKEVWNKKKYKYKKSCPLLKAIFRVNLTRLILMCIFAFITFSLEFIGIVLFREYILYFETKQNFELLGLSMPLSYMGVACLVCRIIYIFISRQSNIVQSIVGFKSGIELASLIYDKILKVGAKSRGLFTDGEITNLIQIDCQKMGEWLYYAPQAVLMPFQFAGYIYLLFLYLGISFLFGLGAMFISFIFIAILQSKYSKLEENLMHSKDDRMRITAQTFNSLKILKLYAWEDEFMSKINESRKKELVNFRAIMNYDVAFFSLYWSVPVTCSIASIGAYTYSHDEMDVANIMASLTIFYYMQGFLWMLPWFITCLIDTLVALGRIQKLLFQPDVDDSVIEQDDKLLNEQNISIKIENACFGWAKEDKNVNTDEKQLKSEIKRDEVKDVDTSHRRFTTHSEFKVIVEATVNAIQNESHIFYDDILTTEKISASNIKTILTDVNLEIKKGELVCVIGEVGSGKSSLIQAILNNMIIVKKTEFDRSQKVVVNGTISYVSQNSWIMNETFRNNILFFNDYNEEKFNSVIRLCELDSDLEILSGGDMTEIGEKGINLSGGQKTRVTIARAIYTDRDIFLFDDPLSALDAHVGMKIFQQVLLDYLKNKTRIVVTHALQYIQHMDRILFMKEGKIIFSGTYEEIIRQPFFSELKEKIKIKSEKTQSKEEQCSKSKLIGEVDKGSTEKKKNEEVKRITTDEEQEEGRVKWKIYLKYISYMGGCSLFIFLFVILIFWQSFKTGSDLWLTLWSTKKSMSREENFNDFLIYASLAIGVDLITVLRLFLVTRGIIHLNKNLHDNMISKLIRAPINLFHDTKPKGQIFNRLSRDLTKCSTAGYNYESFLSQFFLFLGAFFICALFEPWSVLIISIIIIISIFISKFYIGAGRDLNRLEGISQSPILSLFSETVAGVSTIRAFNYKHNFKEKLYKKLDEYYKVKMLSSGSNQWFGLYLDLIFFFLLAFLIIFSIEFEEKFTAQSMGLLLTYTISLSENLQYLIMEGINFERSLVALERCDEYTHIVQERHHVREIDQELEQSKWPVKGDIKFCNVSVKYRPDTEVILKNLNFAITGGEKIGVVGRTGSGKSTLCLCLFRILETSNGNIYIDDVDISQIGLKKLRSSLTIIPQDPHLMEGTLKMNFDPIGLYSDKEILDIINIIGLSYLVDSGESVGLKMMISENGDNLSVGEKQLICIGRAILRKSKIVVMDEATSSIDFKTESLIQKAINFALKDGTVITIAHRIKTIINYDRIMVLSNGEIIEFDKPVNLIENKKTVFYQLYSQCNL